MIAEIAIIFWSACSAEDPTFIPKPFVLVLNPTSRPDFCFILCFIARILLPPHVEQEGFDEWEMESACLATLLQILDDLEGTALASSAASPWFVVLIATSGGLRPEEQLPALLLRAGRFNRTFGCGLAEAGPDPSSSPTSATTLIAGGEQLTNLTMTPSQRLDILRLYCGSDRMLRASEKVLRELVFNNTSGSTAGFLGADLENLCKEACLAALQERASSSAVAGSHDRRCGDSATGSLQFVDDDADEDEDVDDANDGERQSSRDDSDHDDDSQATVQGHLFRLRRAHFHAALRSVRPFSTRRVAVGTLLGSEGAGAGLPPLLEAPLLDGGDSTATIPLLPGQEAACRLLWTALVRPLREPPLLAKWHRNLGFQLPSGVLLHGPSGSGTFSVGLCAG